jgi:2-methylcitrate dehydratase PrpD
LRFVAGTLSERLAAWACGLQPSDVPPRVRDLALSQLIAHLGAVCAGARHSLGRRVIAGFGPPFGAESPKDSAYVLAALSMALDFDDTVFAGHVSHASAGVPLAYARAAGLTGEELLLTIVATTEVAARVAAAATLGPFRGQTAAHTHLAGAVCGRCVAERAQADTMVDAMGIAFAQPPWPLHHGFFGSDAKLLTAATPLRTGLDAVDAARAGLHGSPDMLEHPDGFLARFSQVPLPQAVDGLGTRWHTDTLSIKPRPGCAYIDSAIDAAVSLHGDVAARFDQITSVDVDASIFTVGMEQRSAPYLAADHPGVAALNFSTGYSVATALLRGDVVVEDFEPPRVDDPRVWRVARVVTLRHDPELSRRALLATAPVGAALRMAGPAAAGWLAAGAGISEEEALALLAAPEATFESAEKAIGARVHVNLADGSSVSAEVDIPEGAAGPASRAHHRDVARKKLLRNAAPFLGDDGAADFADRLESLPAADATEVQALLDLLGDRVR